MTCEVLVFMGMEQQCVVPDNAHSPRERERERERGDCLTCVHPLEFPLPMRNIAIFFYHTGAEE